MSDFLDGIFKRLEYPFWRSDGYRNEYAEDCKLKLKKLNNNKEVKNFNFLRNKQRILNRIQDAPPGREQKFLLWLVCAVLRPGHKEIHTKYYKIQRIIYFFEKNHHMI